jgi:hypothetical protein
LVFKFFSISTIQRIEHYKANEKIKKLKKIVSFMKKLILLPHGRLKTCHFTRHY